MILIMAEKRGHLSEAQKKTFINIMDVEETLRKGKFTPSFTFKDAQKKWEEIALQLNCIPGANKNWKDWRRTWQDLKKNIKKKSCQMKNYSRETGGGPPMNIIFTEDEENIFKMLDTTTVSGDPLISESVVIDNDDEHNYCSVGGDNNKENQEEIEPSKIPEQKVSTKQTTLCTPQNRKRTSAVQRLEQSVRAQETYAKYLEKKLKLKDEYYKEKLEIMREDVQAKRQIATALEATLNNLTVRLNYPESELDT